MQHCERKCRNVEANGLSGSARGRNKEQSSERHYEGLTSELTQQVNHE